MPGHGVAIVSLYRRHIMSDSCVRLQYETMKMFVEQVVRLVYLGWSQNYFVVC